ncbi:transmembrane protein 53 [Microcaecilia unicolor]|uniref:Transmembrane protein 53 n=1 Tax=Microcaecilia unicolor TaxID=1415580 RepID=A0A6P7Y6H7_9AMPH|nr:transmembrane protein 53 [Microcaecilia unicolor]
MKDTDLDYTIVFPDPSLLAPLDTCKSPVVILLGWGGCKDPHLAKYSDIYRNQGCTVIRYTSPWTAAFFSESFGRKTLRLYAKNLLELLFDYEIEKSPIFFHVFSNNGVMLYRYIVQLLRCHRQFCTLKVVGTVFDSGPGNRNVLGSLRALNRILTSYTNVVFRIILLLLFSVMVVVYRILLYPLTRLFHESHYDVMKKDFSSWPQLYLYSKADKIISAQDVEEMVEARRKYGYRIEVVVFCSSEHVSHLREYPAKYTDACTCFLMSCLQCPPEPHHPKY